MPFRVTRVRIAGALLLTTSCFPLSTKNEPYVRCPADDGRTCPPVQTGPLSAVVYFVGDAGAGSLNRDRLLPVLSEQVAADAAAGADTRVIFLGDNIYENGLRRAAEVGCAPHPDEPFCDSDVRQVDAQLAAAMLPGVRGLFLPGNHDWADGGADKGLGRVMDQHDYVVRADHAPSQFSPTPGCFLGEPIDVGPSGAPVARIFPVDTHLWLLGTDALSARCPFTDRDSVGVYLDRAIRNTPVGTQVIIVAHHPLLSGSKHGGNRGPANLINRAGLLVQDLNSTPYRQWIALVRSVLRDSARPVVYAAGHDHALQVVSDTSLTAPLLHILSGSGSKLSPIQPVADVLNHVTAGLPGFVRLEFLTDGTRQFQVVAVCADAPPRQAPLCRGSGDVQTIYAEALRWRSRP